VNLQILLVLLIPVCLTEPCCADDRTEVRLWPDGVPEPRVAPVPPEELQTGKDGLTRRFNVSEPRLFVHPPATPGSAGAAILIVPGGGFARLADEHEGSEVARWLAEQGITAFQLAYRTPTNQAANPVLGPAQDVQKAVSEIRARAGDWNLDPAKIGVIGFSAGGQAALVATGSPPLFLTELTREDLQPNALILVYPWQVRRPGTDALRDDVNLDPSFPPVLIAQAADDKSSDPLGSLLLFQELFRRGRSVELHVYENGGHGFGMRPRPNAPGTGDWPHRVIDWLGNRGFLQARSN
jgi:acetyl esterase/lipase